MKQSLDILSDDDSEGMLQATLNLTQFLNQGNDIPIEALQKISQNLGDELAPLRKASHQFFQQYIRATLSFKGTIHAMNTRGLIHPNESTRQKNVNSLQSLLISEVKNFNWSIPELKMMHELLCKRIQDPKPAVKNAAEQTFISLIKIEGYLGFFRSVSPTQQEQVKRFVENQKQQNIFPQDFQLQQQFKQQANSMYVVQNLPEVPLQKQQSYQKLNLIQINREQIKYPNETQKGQESRFGVPQVDQAVKSWQGQQKNQQSSDVIFHTPPRLGQKKFDYNEAKDPNKLQPMQSTILSTSTSARSDLPQTLANRLKSKGEMIASKNNQSNETSESSYVPSLMLKDQQKTNMNMRNSNNRQGFRGNGSFHQSEDESFDAEQVKEGSKSSIGPERKIKRAANSSQNFDDSLQPQQSLGKKSLNNDYGDSSGNKDPKSIGKPFKINKTNQNYAQQNDQEEEPTSDQKVSSTTYSKPFQKKQQQQSYEPTYTQPTYQTEDELEELSSPEAIAKILLNELKYDDWQRQFEALNNLRRLIKFHQQILRKFNFHGMITEAIKLIENLRSGLSKNGLLTLYEASNLFKREIDSELDLAMQKLVKKSIDSSTFISEEVTKVMIKLILNCSEQKCIYILQSVYQSKQIQVRINIGLSISNLILKMANEERGKSVEFEKLFQLICAYVVDQSGEVRQLAKNLVFELIDLLGKQAIDNLISKSGKESNKIKTIIDKGRTSDSTITDFQRFQSTQDDIRSPSKTPELKPRQQSIKSEIVQPISEQSQQTQNFKRTGMKMTSTTKSSQPKLKDPQAFTQLEQMLTQAQDHEWKNRIEATNYLFDLGVNHSHHLSQHKLCNRYLDTYMKLINDSNIKIAIQAAQQLLELVPTIKLGIQQNASNVWTGVFQALSSSNIQVRQSTEQIFQNLCEELEITYSVQQICQNILYGPQKSKSLALNLFIDYTNPLYEDKPQIFLKYVIPMIAKIIDDTKPDIKSAVGRFVKILNDVCPEELRIGVPSQKIQLILK